MQGARVLGALHVTPLGEGVAESIRIFKQAFAQGVISPEQG